MRPTRQHRLPQRLDFNLIPAPLDLSRPIVDEKALLPAIIVTPSSPSGETDFSIAFLAPAPKESVFTRLAARLNLPQLKARSFLLVLLPLFILACHLITHTLAFRRPHLHFDAHTQQGYVAAREPDTAPLSSWLGIGDLRHTRDFVIIEPAS